MKQLLIIALVLIVLASCKQNHYEDPTILVEADTGLYLTLPAAEKYRQLKAGDSIVFGDCGVTIIKLK